MKKFRNCELKDMINKVKTKRKREEILQITDLIRKRQPEGGHNCTDLPPPPPTELRAGEESSRCFSKDNVQVAISS